MLQITCPSCDRVFHAGEEHIGKSLRCTRCGLILPIVFKQPSAISESHVSGAATYSNRSVPRTAANASANYFQFRQFYWLLIVAGVATIAYVLQPLASPTEKAPRRLASNAPHHRSDIPQTQTGETAYASRASLPTGTDIIPESANTGNGLLEVINGSNSDSIVVVVPSYSHQAVREVSVRARETATLRNFSEGNYNVYFRTSACFSFGKTLSFEEADTETGRQYVHYTITLTPVPDGNVESSPITAEEFYEATGVRLN